MKRASNGYRLQLIKEVAIRTQASNADPTDPMACHIRAIMSEQHNSEPFREINSKFNGLHFDAHAGGWVSDRWSLK
ncbi:hypothetical protein [Vibrio ziniensis]|uniref:Uncharacterized protein n=1 Tax=Vibrio ziniensis TaxID=2711221 RepID=A0A6G7CIU1_9VIBR|nr:hypothetical protein [Vibrio ziniensis]QIH42022.1 hypothetical protein G5S32_08460 [Vibrio ziniensis]